MLSTLPGQPPPSQAALAMGALAIVLGLCALGCQERPRPWSGRPDGGVVVEPSAFLPTSPTPAALPDSSAGQAPQPEPSAAPRPSRVGGLWVSCYGGFRPSGDPKRDVTRLGMLCGPPNGLRQLGETMVGQLDGNKVAAHALPARSGACYRLFATAAEPIEDLNVTVRSPRGSVLARDDSHDRWPIVEPERPFCSFEDADFSVELHAARAGRYALAIWQLPASPARRAR